jgi:hypothetical protein
MNGFDYNIQNAFPLTLDYLSQKAQSTYFAEKLTEAEHEAAKPNAVWLDENKFWSEDD